VPDERRESPRDPKLKVVRFGLNIADRLLSAVPLLDRNGTVGVMAVAIPVSVECRKDLRKPDDFREIAVSSATV
jgi:hypothetical protein